MKRVVVLGQQKWGMLEDWSSSEGLFKELKDFLGGRRPGDCFVFAMEKVERQELKLPF